MRPHLATLVVSLGLAVAAGCKKEPPAPPPAPSAKLAPVAPRSPPAPITQIGDGRDGSSIVLARLGDHKVALVSDEDTSTVRALDLATKEPLASLPIPGRPGPMLVTKDGKLLVALRDDGAVAVLEAHRDGSLEIVDRIPTPTEPVALALAPDARTLYVATGWSHTLEGFELATKKQTLSLDVEREPRAVHVSQDGTKLFVSHGAAGSVEAIDIVAKSKATIDLGIAETAVFMSPEPDFHDAPPQSQLLALIPIPADLADKGDLGAANTKFAPMVVDRLSPPPMLTIPARFARQGYGLVEFDAHDSKKKSLGHRMLLVHDEVLTGNPRFRSSGYGGGGLEGAASLPTNQLSFSVLDSGSGARKALVSAPPSTTKDGCRLPRAAIVDEHQSMVFAACLGSDAVHGFALEDDRVATSPKLRIAVPSPNGLALDPETSRVWVLSTFDRSLTSFDDDGAGKSETIHLPGEPMLSALQLEGRKLFHDAGDPRIAGDGRSCSSCHPEGRDDGLTWSTPNGPRQTIQLAGRVNRPGPFGWMGKHASLQIHMTETMKNLKGTGLTAHELDALAAYLAVMKGPPQKWRALTNEEARGRDVFNSTDTGCGGCHEEKRGFSDHDVHDVKSATLVDATQAFLVPSLTGVGGSGPYFHDGRYANLDELLTKSDGTMGTTKSLSPEDRRALVAYLETL